MAEVHWNSNRQPGYSPGTPDLKTYVLALYLCSVRMAVLSMSGKAKVLSQSNRKYIQPWR